MEWHWVTAERPTNCYGPSPKQVNRRLQSSKLFHQRQQWQYSHRKNCCTQSMDWILQRPEQLPAEDRSSKTTKLEAVKTYQYNGKRTKEWCTVGREESPLMLTTFQLGCISKVGMNQQMLSRTKNWHNIFNHTPFRKKPRQILVNSARTTEPLT